MVQMNIMEHTKLKLNFGNVEKVDLHGETRVIKMIKNNDMKAGESSTSIVKILRIYGMLYGMMITIKLLMLQ